MSSLKAFASHATALIKTYKFLSAAQNVFKLVEGSADCAPQGSLYREQDAMERKRRRRGCGLIVNVEE